MECFVSAYTQNSLQLPPTLQSDLQLVLVSLASAMNPTENYNLHSPQNWGDKAVLQKTYKNAKSFNSVVFGIKLNQQQQLGREQRDNK